MLSPADFGTLFLTEALPPKARSLRHFAEEEIVLPEDGGPHQGEAFSCDFQPCFGLFFDEVDSGRWSRVAGVGPTQTGKTLGLFVLPTLRALFELQENVVCGIPTMLMAHDKWTKDFLPTIRASENLAAQLPRSGQGSKGGRVHSEVTFRNGRTLRFMSAGSGDTGRAGFTARVLTVTEADGMARTSDNSVSVEANVIEQLQGRLRSLGLLERLIFLEGTVGIETGLIWREYTQGSAARIMLRCWQCKAWVSPEREHLRGYQDAESEWEAFDKAHWICPLCEKPWTEDQRREANHHAVLCHKGQTVTKRGRLDGPYPRVFTFGFRYSAVNNLFLSASDLGAELWRDSHTLSEEDAEKKATQQVFAVPYIPPDVDLAPLIASDVVNRVIGPKKGIAPAGTAYITVGIDTALARLDWVAIAWQKDGSGRVIEYGEFPVTRKLGATQDLLAAFHGLLPLLHWSVETGESMEPAAVFIDAHYAAHTAAVFEFIRQRAKSENTPIGSERFWACWGEGYSNHMAGRYRHPNKSDRFIRFIGKRYYCRYVPEERLFRVHIDGDTWKTEVRDRMSLALDQPGALTLYTGPPGEHRGYSEELCAERPVQRWDDQRGEYIVWERIRRRNHKLDATMLGTAAGHFVAAQAAKRRAQAESADWWANRKRRRRA